MFYAVLAKVVYIAKLISMFFGSRVVVYITKKDNNC